MILKEKKNDFFCKKKISPVNAVYLHIPFCRKICPFCSFTVRKDRSNMHEKYIEGVINEIERRSKFLKDIELNKKNEEGDGLKYLESLYVGGGTPSRLSIDYVSLLIKKVQDCFPWSNEIEITFEINPEDVTKEYLKNLYEIGINRISLGGQSFNNSVLNQLGRAHSNNELREAIKNIKFSKIKNWNLDLIFGVPKQNFLMFKNDVDEAISYDPPHISLYGLEIHENTSFGKNPKLIEWESKHHELYREMYLWAIQRLKKEGLIQYEVSNFSKKGKQSKNNILVWSGNEYLGFGVGAHSYFDKIRWNNKRSLKNYLEDLHKKKWPTEFEEKIYKKKQAMEFLMLSLRQVKGLNVYAWEKHFGIEFQKKQKDFVKTICDSGFAFWEGNNLCLTPYGLLIVDSITLELLPSDIKT